MTVVLSTHRPYGTVPRRRYCKRMGNAAERFMPLARCGSLGYARQKLIEYRNGWPLGVAAGLEAEAPEFLDWYTTPAERALTTMHDAMVLDVMLSAEKFFAVHDLAGVLQRTLVEYVVHPDEAAARSLVRVLSDVIARLNLILHALCRRHGLRA